MAGYNINVGAIGENSMIIEILWNGSSPVNLNQIVKQAPNVDILAAKGLQKVVL